MDSKGNQVLPKNLGASWAQRGSAGLTAGKELIVTLICIKTSFDFVELMKSALMTDSATLLVHYTLGSLVSCITGAVNLTPFGIQSLLEECKKENRMYN